MDFAKLRVGDTVLFLGTLYPRASGVDISFIRRLDKLPEGVTLPDAKK